MKLVNIICHRGFWTKENEKNSNKSFINAFDRNFGIETDVRDSLGKLVISHDIPNHSKSFSLNDFFEIYKKYNNEFTIFLNIKSDGIKELILESIKKYKIKNYFLFDMSIPEMVKYANDSSLNFLTRISDLEIDPILIDKSQGIWVDSFEGEYPKLEKLTIFLKKGLNISFVSPELHQRSYKQFWIELKKWIISNSSFIKGKNKLFICTDYPIEASRFFNMI